MAKKNATKPANQAGKKKKQQEPLSRQERRAKGLEKRKKKEEVAKVAAPIRETPGLTLAQLEAINPRKSAENPAVVVERDFVEALGNSLDQRLGIPTRATQVAPLEPEPSELELVEEEEDLSTMALRKVMVSEITNLLSTTQPLFDGLSDSPELAEAITVVLFEEGGPMAAQLAEVLVSDRPAEAIADLLEEVGSKVYELQLVAGALRPDYELERSARLEFIEPDEAGRLKEAATKEAARLNLQQRLAEILAGGGMIDIAVAGLIDEGEKEAAAERQRRAQFRQKLAHGLRERKQKEGRRFSGSPEKSGDEEFIKFLMDNRGDLEAVRHNLPAHLREQVEILLRDEKRKAPILRRIAEIRKVAQRRWVTIQNRLQAGADQPEETVVSHLRSIRVLRDELAQIRELGVELKKLDEPEKISAKPDYGTSSWVKTRDWSPNVAIAEAFEKFRAA